jgi:hypothetical protein
VGHTDYKNNLKTNKYKKVRKCHKCRPEEKKRILSGVAGHSGMKKEKPKRR